MKAIWFICFLISLLCIGGGLIPIAARALELNLRFAQASGDKLIILKSAFDKGDETTGVIILCFLILIAGVLLFFRSVAGLKGYEPIED